MWNILGLGGSMTSMSTYQNKKEFLEFESRKYRKENYEKKSLFKQSDTNSSRVEFKYKVAGR